MDHGGNVAQMYGKTGGSADVKLGLCQACVKCRSIVVVTVPEKAKEETQVTTTGDRSIESQQRLSMCQGSRVQDPNRGGGRIHGSFAEC